MVSGIEISETLNSQDREQGSKRKKKSFFYHVSIFCPQQKYQNLFKTALEVSQYGSPPGLSAAAL